MQQKSIDEIVFQMLLKIPIDFVRPAISDLPKLFICMCFIKYIKVDMFSASNHKLRQQLGHTFAYFCKPTFKIFSPNLMNPSDDIQHFQVCQPNQSGVQASIS